MKTFDFRAKIRCNLNDISYLSETQKNNFQFLNKLAEAPGYAKMKFYMVTLLDVLGKIALVRFSIPG